MTRRQRLALARFRLFGRWPNQRRFGRYVTWMRSARVGGARALA